MFARGVDVRDRRAGAQQGRADRAHIVERQACGGQREQAGTAAGDQGQDVVVWAGAGYQFQDAASRGETGFVR